MREYTNTSGLTIDRDQMRRIAPSIFATSPWERMSDRYRQVPTIEVVDVLEGHGFLPVKVAQSRTRIPGKGEFTKHMIRFRCNALAGVPSVDREIPELVMVNSHDGSSSYKFMSGIFRLVCSNGMIVQSADCGSIAVHHKGGEDFSQRILDATYEIIEQAPRTHAAIEGFKQLQLTGPQQHAFAEAAATLRDNDQVKPYQLLSPRRHEDRPAPDGSRSLWTTFNAVQENMTKGGLRTVNPATGRRNSTRAITSVDADVKTNKALWVLADRMAQLVS